MKSAHIRHWRWDLIGVAGASLLYSLITTSASGYFVHADAASQDFMALAWINNCWEFISEKMTSMFVLAPLFRLFGANPFWDTVSLAIVAAITLTLVFELTLDLTGSRLAAFIAVLFLSALPAYQFFSRVHISYVLAFFTGAWLAIRRKHWGWAGFCFAMSPMSHFGATVPVGIALVVLALLYLRQQNWKQWLALITGGLAPILAVEALFFLYTGQIFAWTRATLLVGLRWTGVGPVTAPSPVATPLDIGWLPRVLLGSNGLVLTLALMLVLPAFFLLLRKDKLGAAMLGTSLLTAMAFAVVATLRSGFVSRSLAPLYPIWAVGVAIMVSWLLEQVTHLRLREVSTAAWIGILALFVIQTGSFIRAFTQTPFPQLEPWFQRAIAEGRPVRYNGLPWIASYYFAFQGDEVLVNDTRWAPSGTTGQDVLIFQNEAPSSLSQVNYTISTITVDASNDTIYPILTDESGIPRRYEIWWPTQKSLPIGAQTFPLDGQVDFYYSGVGCATPAPYGGGTLFFYQLVWNKLTQAFGG